MISQIHVVIEQTQSKDFFVSYLDLKYFICLFKKEGMEMKEITDNDRLMII